LKTGGTADNGLYRLILNIKRENVQTEKVLIEKVIGTGLGLGRLVDGMVVMLPYVLPGEEVVIKPQKRKKKYLEAEPVEIVKVSPQRIIPPCPHFGICGGCDLQHAEYPYQVELKEAILREQLGGGGETLEGLMEAPVLASNPFGYRQRLRLQVDEDGRYGFFRNRSHQVEAITSCPLARPEITEAMEMFTDSSGVKHLLTMAREVELLSSPGDESLVLIFNLRRKPRPTDIKAADRVANELANVKGVYLGAEGSLAQGPFCGQAMVDGGKSLMMLMPFPGVSKHGLAPYTLSQEAGGFSQINIEQNEIMIEIMLDWVAGLKAARGLDLFCGMGNFTIPLAAKVSEVVGMDLQRAAIRSAARNVEAAGLDNCLFQQKAAVAGIEELTGAGEKFDLVLLDPPRRGCREVLPHLAGIGHPAVIYISCDPATLARDIRDMADMGYSLKKARMIDMFPQTHHLETMALLTR